MLYEGAKMKTVKIEEAIKQWRESGRKCSPCILVSGNNLYNYTAPFNWPRSISMDVEFELEPRTRKVKGEGWIDTRKKADNRVWIKLSEEICDEMRGIAHCVKITYEYEVEE